MACEATAVQVLGSGASSSGIAFPLSQVSWEVSKEEIIWAGSPWFVHLGYLGDKSPVENSVTLGRIQALGLMTHWLCRKGTHLDVALQEWWQGLGTLGEAKQDLSHVNSGWPGSADLGTTCFSCFCRSDHQCWGSWCFLILEKDIYIYTRTAVSSSGGLLEKEQFMPRP